MDNIEISKIEYTKLLAAARELEVIKADVDTTYTCQMAIWNYCKKNPEIIEFYREKEDEDEEDIIYDLGFIDIVIYEMENK